jgi:hypothetical protein
MLNTDASAVALTMVEGYFCPHKCVLLSELGGRSLTYSGAQHTFLHTYFFYLSHYRLCIVVTYRYRYLGFAFVSRFDLSKGGMINNSNTK